MTNTANHSDSDQGKFRRALAAVGTFLQSLDSTSFDDTLDRINCLEREVRQLKEELRQSRDRAGVGARDAGADPLQSGSYPAGPK